MPKSPEEELLEKGVRALKSQGKPYHEAGSQAVELLKVSIELSRMGRANKDTERLKKKVVDIATQLDRSHPIEYGTWGNWATRVAQIEHGIVSRGHALRALKDLRDSR